MGPHGCKGATEARLLTVAGGGTLALAVLLWLDIPTVQDVPGWFWRLHASKLSLVAAMLTAACSLVAFVCVTCLFRATSTLRCRYLGVTGLVLLGFVYHHALALAVGRGLEEMRERITLTGHAEFGMTASRDVDIGDLLVNYERFVAAPDQRYASSKPPGQLLVYFALTALSDRLMPLLYDPPPPISHHVVNRRHYRFINFATLFFPLAALLVLFPLTYLGRVFLGPTRASWPSFIYVLAPAPALIQLHMDQVLYPSLAASFWALVAAASTRTERAWPWWLLSGAMAWVSLFISFSLLPMLVVAVGVAVASSRRRVDPTPGRQLFCGALIAMAALLALGLLAYALINYDPIRAYSRAMQNHLAWKHWNEALRWRAARLNVLEMGYWLGPTLVVLFAHESFRILRPGVCSAPTRLGLWTLLAIGLTSLLGRTFGEVARLWMFFIPAVVVTAAAALGRSTIGSDRASLTLVAVLQVTWTLSLKARQDFY